MIAADRKPFAKLIGDVQAFYQRDTTDFTLGVWWQACQPFELDAVRQALTQHAMDPERGRFPPMPSDVVRVLSGTKTDRALMAWAKVFDAISAAGAYRSVCFDEPAINATVADLGGWPAVCGGQEKDLSHLQHRFCQTYRAYVTQQAFEFPGVLVGLSQQANALAGRPVEPPTLIGDPNAALRVSTMGAAGPRTRVTQQIANAAGALRIGQA